MQKLVNRVFVGNIGVEYTPVISRVLKVRMNVDSAAEVNKRAYTGRINSTQLVQHLCNQWIFS